MVGAQLEKAGWRQGSVVNAENLQYILETAGLPFEDDLVLLVASQSCDVAHNNLDAEPTLELSIGRSIDKVDGNFAHNKNPRQLHLRLTRRTGDVDVLSVEFIEIRASEKLWLPKQAIVDLSPCPDRELETRQLDSYVAWLAARYSRPALPTTFNDRLAAADEKGKLKAKAKKGEQLTGIYVEIEPFRELNEDENYSVNLLGTLAADFEGDSAKAEAVIHAYAEVMRAAGMDVTHRVLTENKVSLATIRRFKRLYLDDLSFRQEGPRPAETETVV